MTKEKYRAVSKVLPLADSLDNNIHHTRDVKNYTFIRICGAKGAFDQFSWRAIGNRLKKNNDKKSPSRIFIPWVAVISAKNHKRQRRKRQSVTAKRDKSQTPKVLTAILT